MGFFPPLFFLCGLASVQTGEKAAESEQEKLFIPWECTGLPAGLCSQPFTENSAIQKDSKTSADKQRASHVSAGSDTSSLNADIKEGRFRLK